MKITDIHRTLKAVRPGQFPSPRFPEIAFAGRSNVGKSSLINALVHRHNLVPTSRTPGRTRSVDFYLVNHKFYFVDLPGYGYAAVSKERKQKWQGLVGDYIMDNPYLRLVCLLIDVRRTPGDLDFELASMLEQCAVPTALVATKADKLSRSKLSQAARRITGAFGLEDDLDALVVHSSRTGRGLRDLWQIITAALE